MPDGTVKLVREGPTPAETVRAALDDEAFDAVRLALAAVKQGPLAAYTFEKEDLVIVADEAPGAAEAEADGYLRAVRGGVKRRGGGVTGGGGRLRRCQLTGRYVAWLHHVVVCRGW